MTPAELYRAAKSCKKRKTRARNLMYRCKVEYRRQTVERAHAWRESFLRRVEQSA